MCLILFLLICITWDALESCVHKADLSFPPHRLAAEEQTLLNLIQNKQWTKALGIAVRLGQPGRALKIMKTLLDETPEELPAVMAKMRLDQVAALLEFATSWNTKTKDSREAQVRAGGDGAAIQ